MSKLISTNLTKEKDGIKAIIDVVDGSVTATINFNAVQYFPLILDEDNLKDMKKEIDIVLKRIGQMKKELKPSPIRKVIKRTTTKKSK